METNLPIDRRNLLVLAGTGLAAAALATEDAAAAQLGQGTPNVHGDWVNPATNLVCGIVQAGSMVILINENGDTATGLFQGLRLSVLRGWNVNGLTGVVTNNAQVLRFSNGSQWQKV